MSTGYERKDSCSQVQAAIPEAPYNPVRSNGSTSRVHSEAIAEDEPQCFRHRVGIDANQPTNPRTGQIQAQVADPDVIARTGTGWVRLNFILKPWATLVTTRCTRVTPGPRHTARSFLGSGKRNSRSTASLGPRRCQEGPANSMRLCPSHGQVENEWLARYVEGFVAIVETFHRDIQIFESFNEPDDWHGEERNWVHPGWFAIMLQRIYTVVRSRPALDGITLVSGPLQGLETNRNAAVHYLQSTYSAGKAWFGWGVGGVPFPFDGVGYHLYVKPAYTPDETLQARAVRTICGEYLSAMHQVIRQEEGKDKPLYVSEVGWNSRIDPGEVQRREEFQANSLQVGLETIYKDPLVGLVFWFCTQDFSVTGGDWFYGLYRPGDPTLTARKPAFDAFKAFCERLDGEEPPQYTNQQIINAFYYAAIDLGLTKRWGLMAKAGLRLSDLAADRQGAYAGKPISQLPGLTITEKAAVQARLDEQSPQVPFALLTGDAATVRLAVDDERDADLRLDMVLGVQEQVLQELRKNNELLGLTLRQLAGSRSTGTDFD